MANIEKQNCKLLVDGDDIVVKCEIHNVSIRFGDLDEITQVAVLNGWDVEGEKCILEKRKRS